MNRESQILLKFKLMAIQHKIILLGDTVGKTRLRFLFTEGILPESDIPTIGLDLGIKLVDYGPKQIKMRIFDASGSERFESIVREYIKSTLGVMLVYDITDRRTFDRLTRHITNISKYAPIGVPVVLVGNKIDLEDKRQVTTEEGSTLAQAHNYRFVETSTVSGVGVEAAFNMLLV